MVVAVTGGGSKAISQLLDVAGASRTVLEATVPYAASSLQQWLGGEPEQYCSEQTARSMAMASWMRAGELASDASSSCLVGIGATAGLATNRPKQGEHRVHVAVQTAEQTKSFSLTLVKGLRDRKKEQWLAAKLILLAVGEACGVATDQAREAFEQQLVEGEQVLGEFKQAPTEWAELLQGQRSSVAIKGTSQGELGLTVQPRVVFPGAFNPLHQGHRRMAEVATKRLNEAVTYELSVTNVDKPTLDFVEIDQRVNEFRIQDAEATLMLTAAPTFLEKSALFPGCTFVVGADTMVRIADAKYYPGGQQGCEDAIALLNSRGCRFLVFGRVVQGEFQGLADLKLPASLQRLCDEVSEQEFRQDISSTEIRAGQGGRGRRLEDRVG